MTRGNSRLPSSSSPERTYGSQTPIPAQSSRIRTSTDFGRGTGSVSVWRTSGPPNRSIAAAFIFLGMDPRMCDSSGRMGPAVWLPWACACGRARFGVRRFAKVNPTRGAGGCARPHVREPGSAQEERRCGSWAGSPLLLVGPPEVGQGEVECVELEEVTVSSDGRTRTTVPSPLPIVDAFARAGGQVLRGDRGGEACRVGWDVVEHPVHPRHLGSLRIGRVGIVDDQG